jgi:D-alanyl-D-alanine carboxypeptidase (penicillin-binding protein 5/6)
MSLFFLSCLKPYCRGELLPTLTIIFMGVFVSANSHAVLMPAAPQLAASSYLLVDADSGTVLVEHNADQPLPPASLTKIMTSYIVSSELKKASISFDDSVPVSVKAWKMGGSRMFIKEGTDVRLEDLLRGVIIQSGNDASVALAEYVAGDESTFADMMNQQAFSLGMVNSHFKNATGWPADGHVSTARDLSLLANALINDFPKHYAIYSEKEFTYNDITQPNRNGLLWRDQDVDGIKTGHTDEAGYCLVSSAKRDDMRLISVVMGARSSRGREQETQKLLSYGFRYYQTYTLYEPDKAIEQTRVWGGADKQFNLVLQEPLVVTIPRGEKNNLEAIMEIDQELVAPIKRGEVYGELKLSLNGEVLAKRKLVAGHDVEPAGIFARLIDWLVLLVRGLLGFVS